MELEGIVPKVFLLCAGLATLSCLARPDFNLPLFVFAWLIWTEPEKEIRVKFWGLMVVTFLVDFIWLCYWGSAWTGESGSWESGIHHFVLAMSIINFLVKLGAIVLVFMTEKDTIKGNIPDNLARMMPSQ